MEGVTRFITGKLRLKVNETKSKVAPSRDCAFLGYTIGGKGMLRISKKSKKRMTDRLKGMTRRNRGRKFETVIKEINNYLQGWLEYFKLASAKWWLGKIEQRLRRKLRCYRLKQCKRKFAIAKFLMKNGVPEWRAWILAGSGKGWYRMAESPQAHEAMNTRWFAEQGLIALALPR